MRRPYWIIASFAVRAVLSIGILAGGVAVFVWLGRPEKIDRKKERHGSVPTVETVEAAVHDTGIDFDVDGVVVPFGEIAVSPEAGGRVVFEAADCRLGSYVREGECLFRIDGRNYELDVRRLTQELERRRRPPSQTLRPRGENCLRRSHHLCRKRQSPRRGPGSRVAVGLAG